MITNMANKQHSYWEQDQLSAIDYIIVGSGITGLSCALTLKGIDPAKRILVLEKGVMLNGASMKNAGFACFGSVSEILADAKLHSEQELIELIRSRAEGLETLKTLVSPTEMDFQINGGYEFFTKDQNALAEACFAQVDYVNKITQEALSSVSPVFETVSNHFGFGSVLDKGLVNLKEGQLHVGKMMNSLMRRCAQEDIRILSGVEVLGYQETTENCLVETKELGLLKTQKLLLATNGFTQSILPDLVIPARAQVLITEPIDQLKIKGTFHMDQGYYYFRNIDQRILIGGGRNLDFKGETTTTMGTTEQIQQALERTLRDVVLPKHQGIKISRRWSGIMGLGGQKRPIIQALSERVFCGVRLGGMGVAIGSSVGAQLAKISSK